MATRPCELDLLPTAPVREHATTLAPAIVSVFNLSLQTGWCHWNWRGQLHLLSWKTPGLTPMYINITGLSPVSTFSPSWQRSLWRNTFLNTLHAITFMRNTNLHTGQITARKRHWTERAMASLRLLTTNSIGLAWSVGSVGHYKSCPA